ncbi:MAG: ABC transporter ATP-binding protein [Desulfosarcina sp.]|nr:ABC transporter ATP-binding protein [Desulfosarcina sp.]MBC2767863.1 ABC transporter ATP-binding protein [Desulfosarcina sp.]
MMTSGKDADHGVNPILKVNNVTKKFGELVAVNGLSFTVEKGQVFGIAGPNGAGKSTVYNLITGFYPFEGRIEFDGRDISGLQPHRISQLGISRTFQIPQTFPSLTVEESISVGNRFGAQGRFDPAYVEEIIRFLDMRAIRQQPTGQLNLLGKKKLMMGAALATRPKILMLDEPMAGSNANEIKDLMDFIRRINEDMGVTIIIIEHFMKVLTELTETLLMIETGSEICCGDPVTVTSDPRVIESYLGDAYAEGN